MKSNKIKVVKRTYEIEDAVPRFVSIVSAGANLIPFENIRYSDDEQFSDVMVSSIKFSKEVFKDFDEVSAYMNGKNYVDYTVSEQDGAFVVTNIDPEQFSDLAEVPMDNGVVMYIGKPKTEEVQEVEDESPAATVATVEAYEDAVEEVTTEEATVEVSEEAEPEVSEDEASEEEVAEEFKDEATDEAVEPAEVVNEEVTEDVYSDDVRASDELTKFTSAKYSCDYSDFRATIQTYLDRGFPVSFDAIMYVFSDSVFSALREGQDFAQIKKNANDLVSLLESYSTSIKQVKFEDEASEVSTETVITEEVVEETVVTEEFAVDNHDSLVQNSEEFNLQDIKPKPLPTDAEAARFKDRQKRDLFGISN